MWELGPLSSLVLIIEEQPLSSLSEIEEQPFSSILEIADDIFHNQKRIRDWIETTIQAFFIIWKTIWKLNALIVF